MILITMYVCIFIKLHITAQFGPVIYSFYATVCMYVCMVITYSKSSMDQPGKVANPDRGQLNRENESFPVSVRA